MDERSLAFLLSVRDVLERLDDDDEASSADKSDFEGEEIAGYLPGVSDNFLGGADEHDGEFEDVKERDEVVESSGGPARPGLSKSCHIEYLGARSM